MIISNSAVTRNPTECHVVVRVGREFGENGYMYMYD